MPWQFMATITRKSTTKGKLNNFAFDLRLHLESLLYYLFTACY